MSTQTSPFHAVLHVIMLIIIVSLSSLYFQLRDQYEELSHLCSLEQRMARDTLTHKDHCHEGNKDCFRQTYSSSTTASKNLNSPSSASEYVVNNDKTLSRTGSGSSIDSSLSISHSSFESRGAPFETSETMSVDEFGKTGKASHSGTVGAVPTDSSTDPVLPSETSHMEITKEKAREMNDIKDQTFSETKPLPSSSPANFPAHHSTIVEKEEEQKGAYHKYNNAIYPNDNDSTSVSADFNKDISLSSGASFETDSLSVSKTTQSIATSTLSQPVINNQNFGLTQSEQSLNNYKNSHANNKVNEEADFSNVEEATDIEHTDGMEPNMWNINPEKIQDMFLEDTSLHADRNNFDPDSAEHRKTDNKYTLLKTLDTDMRQKLVQQGTSAFCHEAEGVTICRFKNLCYKIAEHDFVFLKGGESIIDIHPSLEEKDLSSIFDINLSTVSDHNAFKFSPVFVPAEVLHKFPSVAMLERRSYLMSRFKPDNIMHVLHDDIIPLFHTLFLQNFLHQSELSDVVLLFSDKFESDEYSDLYTALSNVPPAPLSNLGHSVDVICLKDTYIGLLNSTLWYQYGFFKPQGPLEMKNEAMIVNVRRAANHLAERIHSSCPLCGNRNYMVLFSRKDNRLMLNEGELMLSIARGTKLKVMSVSMETHSIGEIISIVRNSRGIMGMHGSILIFAIFLQPGSVVVELFPYAVNPLKYTPFKTICDYQGSGIVYKSWVNPDKERSYAHPGRPPSMGGIAHLPANTQTFIMSQSEVPDHLCCEDPSWLYHIYQDTDVDIDAVTSLTVSALSEAESLYVKKSESTGNLAKDITLTPGPVRSITCTESSQKERSKGKFKVEWQSPWNIEFLSFEVLKLQIVFQQIGSDDSISVDLPGNTNFYFIDVPGRHYDASYNVWVTVTVDHNMKGPYSFVTCNSETTER